MQWLGETSTGFSNKLKNILLAFFIYAAYIFLFSQFMEFLYTGQVFREPPFKLTFFLTVIWAPIIEEIIFRVAPISLVKDKPKLILPTIILSSALFGWLHYGAASLPIQGVFGFVLSLVYLKNNHSYWSVVALHALWNAYVMVILEKL